MREPKVDKRRRGFARWWDLMATRRRQQQLVFRSLMRWAKRQMASGFLQWRRVCQRPKHEAAPTVEGITIPRTKTSKEEGTGKPCVFYIVAVNTGVSAYNLTRRYKDFDNFDRILREKYPKLDMPSLPPKKSFGSQSSL